MALFRGMWGALRALGRSGAEMCAGCGGRLPSPLRGLALLVPDPHFLSPSTFGRPGLPPSSRALEAGPELWRGTLAPVTQGAAFAGYVQPQQSLTWLGQDFKVYEADFKAEWKAYKEAMSKFKDQLTPTQLVSFEKEGRQKRLKKKASIKKRELTLLGKPKRPRSAYNIYVSECFQESKEESSQVYIQLAKDDRIRYDNEMKSWEEQMAEVGRSDLIRRSVKRSEDIPED
ncbi:Transcription factor A, mitochondrial [Microtus ochrogaster]|uniref:Transcription factor A, mitochondrial n=1 Tax=Microtus ochrogaster TaxID=79684 RepID=A0A8J6GW71_MICOH|nr:Transcription factor A, mitochondrial [Microtus ochrogaster]